MMSVVLAASSTRTVVQLFSPDSRVADVVTGEGGLAGVVGSAPEDLQRAGGAGFRHHGYIADGGRDTGIGAGGA